jgi:plasmid stabilization system protein ParE
VEATIRVIGQDAEEEAKGATPLLRTVVRQAAERAYRGRGDPNVFAAVIVAAVTRDLVEAAFREAEVVASRNGRVSALPENSVPEIVVRSEGQSDDQRGATLVKPKPVPGGVRIPMDPFTDPDVEGSA